MELPLLISKLRYLRYNRIIRGKSTCGVCVCVFVVDMDVCAASHSHMRHAGLLIFQNPPCFNLRGPPTSSHFPPVSMSFPPLMTPTSPGAVVFLKYLPRLSLIY
jgi:hypothetical protein